MIQVDGMRFAGIDRNAVHGDLKILFFQTTRLKKYREENTSLAGPSFKIPAHDAETRCNYLPGT